MYQRAVSLLLLPCLLLMPAAGMGHAHGRLQPAEHASRPHFHLPLAAHAHSHGHAHGDHAHDEHGHHHGEHGHQHDGHGHQAAATDDADGGSETASRLTAWPQHDHDADAIFVEDVELIRGQRPAADPLLAGAVDQTIASSKLPIRLVVQPQGHSAQASRQASLRSTYACPLYILQRALLI